MGAPRTESTQAGSKASPDQRSTAEASISTPSEQTGVAVAIVTIVGAILTWWGWKQGAYFGNVFFPGAIVLYGLAILLLVAAPFSARLAGPAPIALSALVALALWTLLSIAWTPAQDSAVQNAERAMLYAAAFALGLWCCRLSRSRMLLPLAAVAAAGALVGIATTLTLANGSDVASYLHDDGTLRFPIGYRNANGAFFLICVWPTIALAAHQRTPWQLRALLIGVTTMLLGLVVLSESRGSLPAAAVALSVFIALSPRRLRSGAYLALAALPVLPALPALLDPFQRGTADLEALSLLHDSARALTLTSLGSVVLAAVCIRGLEFRLDLAEQQIKWISRAAAGVAVAAVVVGGVAFVAERGGPVEFLDQRISEFRRGGDPNLQAQGTRFGVNVASSRSDFWRVALDHGGDKPLVGGGAGSWAGAYLKDRNGDQSPKDPHSVELLMFSELGVIGLLLFFTFVVAAGWAGLRSWRRGPPAASALVAGSLGAGAYWLGHSSYDWFWHYPALTATAIFMLGAAASPGLAAVSEGVDRRIRGPAVALVALALLAAVPLFLSQRYANRAHSEWGGDPAGALDDLDRAAALNPLDPRPLLTKGVIETRTGREQEAISTFREALDRETENYAAHYFLAEALAAADPAAAREEVAEALRLNPDDPEVNALRRKLSASAKSAIDDSSG